MSVSVRSNQPLTAPNRGTLSATRHSNPGHVLRDTAANNILSSRHSNTEQKLNNAGRRTTQGNDFGKNTAVITLDELQRIR
jgi:hypothetical protein